MHSRRQHEFIGRRTTLAGVPRRRVLQGAGALGLAAVLCPTAVFAESDDDDERLGPFGPWSTPVNLGPVVNTSFDDNHPAISKNGLSLYITSNRPGGVNGKSFTGFIEIWVSQRASLNADWGPPVNLDAFNSTPVINAVGSGTAAPNFSDDGHLMFFQSARPGGYGGADLYVSRRTNKHDDFGWQKPVNLGGLINTSDNEYQPTFFEDEETGIVVLYLVSDRPGGPVGSDPGSYHTYVSTLDDEGTFGPAVLVPELSSRYNETRTAIRRDGLELFLTSERPNGRIGVKDIWVSTRDSTLDPWSTPVNLGSTVSYGTGGPTLSWDGTTLYFFSDRPGGFNAPWIPPFPGHTGDIYVTTRERIRGDGSDDDQSENRIHPRNNR